MTLNSRKIEIFPNINDQPRLPTAVRAGNVSHLINVHNGLVDDLQTHIINWRIEPQQIDSGEDSFNIDLQFGDNIVLIPGTNSNGNDRNCFLTLPGDGFETQGQIGIININANNVRVNLNGQLYQEGYYDWLDTTIRFQSMFLLYINPQIGWISTMPNIFVPGFPAE